MTQSDYQYVFGPVPSRRLGRSLGIDLIPYKTCSYDCIYCQLGRTTNKTIVRDEWVSMDTIVEQIQQRLEELQTPPDYITLSGSGEPTLYSRIDELIEKIKTFSSIPIAILTNGSLLYHQEVRKQLMQADLIIPSLDAGSEFLFGYVNRPHDSIRFSDMLDGLIQLRREFKKQYWLEVFLLGGHNVIQTEIEKIVRCVDRIRPDKIQLNTVVRPPAEDFAYTVAEEQLKAFASLFNPHAEVIAEYRGSITDNHSDTIDQDILAILQRRSCTLDDLSKALGISHNHVIKSIEYLSGIHAIVSRKMPFDLFYSCQGKVYPYPQINS